MSAYLENSIIISAADYVNMKQTISQLDVPAIEIKTIRKIYFDKEEDIGVRDIYNREGFAISFDVDDMSDIIIEKKSNRGSINYESFTKITLENLKDLILGAVKWLKQSDNGILNELYWHFNINKLRPSIIMDCTQEKYLSNDDKQNIIAETSIKTSGDLNNIFSKELPSDNSLSNLGIIVWRRQEVLLSYLTSGIFGDDTNLINTVIA